MKNETKEFTKCYEDENVIEFLSPDGSYTRTYSILNLTRVWLQIGEVDFTREYETDWMPNEEQIQKTKIAFNL